MTKVDMNCWCKVLTQSFGANFHHHTTCIKLHDDARNKKLKFCNPTLSVHFVVFVSTIHSSSHHSCLQLLYIYLFALFVVRSSSYSHFAHVHLVCWSLLAHFHIIVFMSTIVLHLIVCLYVVCTPSYCHFAHLVCWSLFIHLHIIIFTSIVVFH
jgi:hypothetical protein